jgi:hypothetical protein
MELFITQGKSTEAMNSEQQQFLDDFMNNFNMKYIPRYKAGVMKYKSTIHKDYTIDEHIENLEQELFDALAYLHAIRLMRENNE